MEYSVELIKRYFPDLTAGQIEQFAALRDIYAEWNAKINAFIKENEQSTTSNLAEANTLNIIYELRRRGFKGIVMLQSEDGANVLESYDLDKSDWNRDDEE